MGVGLLAWSIYGVSSSILEYYASLGSTKPMTWGSSFAHECAWAFLLAALSPAVRWLAASFRPERPQLERNVAIHVVATILYGALAHVIWDGWMRALGYPEPQTLAKYLISISWGAAEGAPIYWLILFVHNAGYYQQRYQVGLVKASELNAQLARAQLQSLKMQLHPHFLFNTLHAISELIHENTYAAESMVLGLSQLLRMSLDTSTSVEVPLRQELRFTEIYLSIEKMRFDDRLEIELDIDDDVQDAMVPSLILQPLLENAITHGISKRPGQGKVQLCAKKVDGSLMIAIRDNGAGCDVDRTPLREGIGLSTTRARLEKMYGAGQSFRFVRRQGDGAEAVMRIPLRIEMEEAAHAFASSNCR